ncbi:hypothetical protein ABB26_04970 [Stenotrophomonas humi]|uniref:Uncharacterized protein n=1 Tax=Stenotrophomonas humi TaxID=405444 RepID=A0A0R0C761_9GAMM|nr:hypothetical protein [Stenotrophomonas humi]KRG65168.1 hypothetical protein ABB26_04970 [Stenotrophomonas humi]
MSGDHHVLIAVIKDSSQNPSNWKKRSLGAIGEYGKSVTVTRVGMCREAVCKIRVSSPIKRDLIAAAVKLEPRSG